nr:serine hydrolase [Acidaminobacter sp. JC074]
MGKHVSFSVDGFINCHHQENIGINPASVIKLSVLYAGLIKIDKGLISLDDMIPYSDGDLVMGAGSLKDLSYRLMSLKDLLMLMITLSDNSATNILMDYIGLEDIQRIIEHLGTRGTYPRRKLYHMIPGVFNEATTKDTNLLLKAFDLGIGLTQDSQILAMDILKRQQFKNFAMGLNVCKTCGRVFKENMCMDHPGAQVDEVEIFSKSGEINGHVHDAAIFKYSGKTVYFTMFTYKQEDNEITKQNFRDIGCEIFNLMRDNTC